MNFGKGMMIGVVAGTIVGVMNSGTISFVANRSIRKIKKMKKKYGI